MENIPVTFDLNGKTYKGRLFKSHEAESSWSLNIGPEMKSWHWGRLYLYNDGSWGFHWNVKGLEQLQDYFVDVLLAWYE